MDSLDLSAAAAAAARFASAWQVVDQAVTDTLREHTKQLESIRSAHKRQTERLAQSLRRLRTFENETQWSQSLADAAQLSSPRVIIFSINVDKLRFEAARGFEISSLAEIPLAQAAAFETAVTSGEPAVALKTKRELSEPLAALLGEDASTRFSVYPVTTRQRVPAVIYAEDADAALLDLISTAAGAALESHRSTPTSPSLVSISPAATGSSVPFVSRDEEERHSRALRFARVQVAEIRLYDSQAVKTGRLESNLYRALKPQIDEVRRVYQEQHLKNAPNMSDYLHQEILRTLANGNSELLGPDYPGPLV
ncbi:MAG TPA: hypothetical protein VGL53_29745 [Bryobacteraceae bacterium]